HGDGGAGVAIISFEGPAPVAVAAGDGEADAGNFVGDLRRMDLELRQRDQDLALRLAGPPEGIELRRELVPPGPQRLDQHFGFAELLADRLVVGQALVLVLVDEAGDMPGGGIERTAGDAFPDGAETDQVDRRDTVIDDLLALAPG